MGDDLTGCGVELLGNDGDEHRGQGVPAKTAPEDLSRGVRLRGLGPKTWSGATCVRVSSSKGMYPSVGCARASHGGEG